MAKLDECSCKRLDDADRDVRSTWMRNKTGLDHLHFQPRRRWLARPLAYLVDGAFDLRYTDGGVSNFETLQGVGAAGPGWQMLRLERRLTLSPEPHTITVQVFNDGGTIIVTTPEILYSSATTGSTASLRPTG